MRREMRAWAERCPDDAATSSGDEIALGARVADQVARLPEYRAARSIALYAAADGELPTRQLLEVAQREGLQCALPRVLPEGRLEFAVASDWENLERGRYGLLEPGRGSPVVSLRDVDLVLVPGLAFDEQGGRLGRGGGYYDRALAERDGAPARSEPGAPIFGLAHEWQVVDAVPCGAHDVRVDGIVTELRVRRTDGQEHQLPWTTRHE